MRDVSQDRIVITRRSVEGAPSREEESAGEEGAKRKEKRKGRRRRKRKDGWTSRGPEVHEEPLKYVKRHGPLRLPLLPLPFWEPSFFRLFRTFDHLTSAFAGVQWTRTRSPAGVTDVHNRSQILFPTVLSIYFERMFPFENISVRDSVALDDDEKKHRAYIYPLREIFRQRVDRDYRSGGPPIAPDGEGFFK